MNDALDKCLQTILELEAQIQRLQFKERVQMAKILDLENRLRKYEEGASK